MDKVCADVVLLHGCPQSCMTNPVKSLLGVYEDMVEVLLVLEKFLTQVSYAEDHTVQIEVTSGEDYR